MLNGSPDRLGELVIQYAREKSVQIERAVDNYMEEVLRTPQAERLRDLPDVYAGTPMAAGALFSVFMAPLIDRIFRPKK